MNQEISIIGAGLTGLLCALHLADRSYKINIFERRFNEEIFSTNLGSKGKYLRRSLSMDLSVRGIHALDNMGVFSEIKKKSVPMNNKIYHNLDGELLSIPYGRNPNEYILTAARSHIYNTLLNSCRNNSNIKIYFGFELLDIDFNSNTIFLNDHTKNKLISISPKIIIAADGINSLARKKFSQYCSSTFEFIILTQGYKELTIPKNFSQALEFKAMHIWPREGFMLVAQPNFDQSFTCALILGKENSPHSFASINNEGVLLEFFKRYLSDAINLLPKLFEEYFYGPMGSLGSVKGENWTINGKFLLLGDAVHGMTPFFGQGVNCCFEDCTILNHCLDMEKDNWQKALSLFNEIRIRQANAISAMSYENYPELLEKNNLKQIMIKKQVEEILIRKFNDDYISYHNLVCFHHVPYDYANQVKTLQDCLLNKITLGLTNIDDLDFDKINLEMALYKKSLSMIKHGDFYEPKCT